MYHVFHLKMRAWSHSTVEVQQAFLSSSREELNIYDPKHDFEEIRSRDLTNIFSRDIRLVKSSYKPGVVHAKSSPAANSRAKKCNPYRMMNIYICMT